MSRTFYIKPREESAVNLLFTGVGEAFDPTVPNSSVLLEHDETVILVDCGPTVPQQIWQHNSDPEYIDFIILTHFHGDHTFGVPFLLVKNYLAGRKKPCIIAGPPGISDFGRSLIGVAYPSFWDKIKDSITFQVIDPQQPQSLTPTLTLSSAYSDHSMQNNALRFDFKGTSVALSGDGGPTPETRNLYKGVDLLIHECYTVDATIGGHTTFSALMAIAPEIEVSHLALVHIAEVERTRVINLAKSRDATLVPHVFVPAAGDRCVL